MKFEGTKIAGQIEYELDLPRGILPRDDSEQNLLTHVSKIVERMMEENPGGFFNMLYIMDVDETAIRKILENKIPSETPSISIAKLIIEREWRKVRTREAYKNWETPNEDW